MLERGLSPVLSSHTCAMIFHSITIITMVRFDRFDQQLVVVLKKNGNSFPDHNDNYNSIVQSGFGRLRSSYNHNSFSNHK